jgi:hypothetical protein
VRAGAPAHEHVPSYYDADAVHVTEKFILGLARRYRVREVVADPHRYSAPSFAGSASTSRPRRSTRRARR